MVCDVSHSCKRHTHAHTRAHTHTRTYVHARAHKQVKYLRKGKTQRQLAGRFHKHPLRTTERRRSITPTPVLVSPGGTLRSPGGTARPNPRSMGAEQQHLAGFGRWIFQALEDPRMQEISPDKRQHIVGSRVHAAQNAFGVEVDDLKNQFDNMVMHGGLSSPAARTAATIKPVFDWSQKDHTSRFGEVVDAEAMAERERQRFITRPVDADDKVDLGFQNEMGAAVNLQGRYEGENDGGGGGGAAACEEAAGVEHPELGSKAVAFNSSRNESYSARSVGSNLGHEYGIEVRHRPSLHLRRTLSPY
mmetsp:Transcript_96400/g.274778  ORF Transcript_96400/g.274778 Transcript_96400/m.274778 type:complete len:304 (+) Transcript_96400:392-1303(+)